MVLAAVALAMHASLTAAAETEDVGISVGQVRADLGSHVDPSLGEGRGQVQPADLTLDGQHSRMHPSLPCRSACCGSGSACMTGLPVGDTTPMAPTSSRALRVMALDIAVEDFDPTDLGRPPNS